MYFFIWKTLMSTYFFRQREPGIAQGQPGRRHVYEIKTWLWNLGSPQPRVDGFSVPKTEKICRHSISETSRRTWKTRQARKRAADEEESS
jgi:hypothetical protein